jgi:hypothetical protein
MKRRDGARTLDRASVNPEAADLLRRSNSPNLSSCKHDQRSGVRFTTVSVRGRKLDLLISGHRLICELVPMRPGLG